MTPRALRGMAVNEVGRARISMMVRSMGSNSRPDTLVQDRTPQPHRFLLQRTAGPYIGVKHFQTIRRCSVDVARGLVLLFGIGTKALPSWGSKTRRNNLFRGLAVRRTAGPSGSANSPHPSSREGHHFTARWNSSVSPIAFGLESPSCRCDVPGPAKLGAVNPDAMHYHGQPACQRLTATPPVSDMLNPIRIGLMSLFAAAAGRTAAANAAAANRQRQRLAKIVCISRLLPRRIFARC